MSTEVKVPDVKIPLEIVEICEYQALGQILADWSDKFSVEQIVNELRGLGDEDQYASDPVCDIIVWEPLSDQSGEWLANLFDEYYEAFIEVARLAIVRTQVEVLR